LSGEGSILHGAGRQTLEVWAALTLTWNGAAVSKVTLWWAVTLCADTSEIGRSGALADCAGITQFQFSILGEIATTELAAIFNWLFGWLFWLLGRGTDPVHRATSVFQVNWDTSTLHLEVVAWETALDFLAGRTFGAVEVLFANAGQAWVVLNFNDLSFHICFAFPFAGCYVLDIFQRVASSRKTVVVDRAAVPMIEEWDTSGLRYFCKAFMDGAAGYTESST